MKEDTIKKRNHPTTLLHPSAEPMKSTDQENNLDDTALESATGGGALKEGMDSINQFLNPKKAVENFMEELDNTKKRSESIDSHRKANDQKLDDLKKKYGVD